MILSCGEALIDMLPRQSTGGEAAFAPYAGGAVFNTAIALGRLGAPSGFLSGLSTDLFGEILTDSLTASKVDSSLAIRSARPTTLAFVKLVDGQASYAFYDENTAGRMIRPEDMPALPDNVGTVFFFFFTQFRRQLLQSHRKSLCSRRNQEFLYATRRQNSRLGRK